MNILEDYGIIHFIGVLGSSMSNLARLFLARGKRVSGSDARYTAELSRLKALGADVYVGSNEGKVKNAELVIYTQAVSDDDVELKTAREQGIPSIERGEALGNLCRCFTKTVAVSGTHGKSTVTAMIGHVMREHGTKVLTHIGGEMREQENPDLSLIVTEACEYRESFLSIEPDVGVILNVESDHPDYYGSISSLYRAFNAFSSNVKRGGVLIKPADLPIDCSVREVRVGEDVLATDLHHDSGYYDFVPVVYGQEWERIRLKVPGVHNVYNALFALSASLEAGAKREAIERGLSDFKGIARRFESAGEINGARVIIDYAHHPTEISAVISASRTMTKGHVTVLFQPHTYSRTAHLFHEFAHALSSANVVVIMKEYPARETPDMGKNAFELYREILARGQRARYVTSAVEAREVIARYAYPGDMILVLGAGDVDEVVRERAR